MFLFEKPWLTTGIDDFKELRKAKKNIRPTQIKLGLRILIVSMSILFFIAVVAYVTRMKVADWKSITYPGMLWANTALLIFSSIAMQLTVYKARQKQTNKIKSKFLIAGLLAWTFVLGQLLVWHSLNDSGYFISSNPANSFFYMLTALHGLHLLGGLGVWAYAILNLDSNTLLRVEICATYWHFLLVIWIILYGLLLLT